MLIEGFYKLSINKNIIEEYFKKIIKALNLKVYKKPIIFSPKGEGKEINQGYDAFIPLIDFGISLYVWANVNFLSLIIYSCKSFDKKKSIEVTREFFKINEIEAQSF